VERTVRLKLKTTPEQGEALRETTAQFTASFNRVCQEGWRLRVGNAFTLQRFVYYENRAAHPALVSDHQIQAIRKGAEAVRSAIALSKKGKKVSCPHAAVCPPRYNLHTCTLDWEAAQVRLSTTGGRFTVRFRLRDYARYARGYPVATADLIE
jgi:hypothetical protein